MDAKIAKTFYIEAILTLANHMHCNSILSNDIDSAACSIPFTKLLSHIETLIEEWMELQAYAFIYTTHFGNFLRSFLNDANDASQPVNVNLSIPYFSSNTFLMFFIMKYIINFRNKCWIRTPTHCSFLSSLLFLRHT